MGGVWEPGVIPARCTRGMREMTHLAQKAASQFSLLTTSDLRECDFSKREISTLVKNGVLRRERRGLFLFGAPDGRWEQDLMRACLAGARRGVVSHRSAQRLWDLRPWETVVEITVRGFASPMVEGAITHRTWDLVPADITWVDGLPVTSVARTLCDAGVHHHDREVARMVEVALGRSLVTVAELRGFRKRVGRQGRTGVVALDEALGDLGPEADKVDSPMEAALLGLIRRAGLPDPVAQFPVRAGGHQFYVDLAYPESRVLLEYDGFVEHIDPVQFARDRQRQNALVLDGWVVLRFSKVDLRDRRTWVAAQIRRACRNPGVNLT